MEPESSLQYSQAPATCPYPEPTPSSPHNPFHFISEYNLLNKHKPCDYYRIIVVAIRIPLTPLRKCSLLETNLRQTDGAS
jgi:hypothetical protein